MASEDLPVLRLGHINGEITTVGFGVQPGDPDVEAIRSADPEQLNSNPNDLAGQSQRNHHWLHSLPEDHQPYFIHLLQLDQLWPSHAAAPPAWVSCPDHPALEAAVADHFSTHGHQVRIGEES